MSVSGDGVKDVGCKVWGYREGQLHGIVWGSVRERDGDREGERGRGSERESTRERRPAFHDRVGPRYVFTPHAETSNLKP